MLMTLKQRKSIEMQIGDHGHFDFANTGQWRLFQYRTLRIERVSG